VRHSARQRVRKSGKRRLDRCSWWRDKRCRYRGHRWLVGSATDTLRGRGPEPVTEHYAHRHSHKRAARLNAMRHSAMAYAAHRAAVRQ